MANIKQSLGHVFDCDASSLYPRVMDQLNTIMSTYYVMNEFPFDVVHKEDIIKYALHYEIKAPTKPFESYARRFDAEIHKLLCLKQFYLDEYDVVNAEKTQKQLDNIKEDHPEWLI